MVRATALRAVRLAATCIVAGMLAACGTTTQPARDGVTALTTVLIVDAAGHIAHRYTRFASGDMARFEADLKALLAS